MRPGTSVAMNTARWSWSSVKLPDLAMNQSKKRRHCSVVIRRRKPLLIHWDEQLRGSSNRVEARVERR